MPTNLNDVNNLLDSLYLELLNLIEQQTNCRVNIEKTTNAGQLLLAKTRYNQGSQTISVAQIPTENSEDCKALCLVTEEANEETVAGCKKSLLRHKVDKNEGYLEPMHWFTILPSMSLRNAAEQFKKSVDLAIESANIQNEMLAIMKSIEHLKALKQQI
ncbi:uncharacterized protein LOC119613691 [Lucilia sericata]|uniref:uncharacterized protein LOC119613691 n=1 Tax=Lucilia sericata TaxID=13632 RepID=UPI0018A7EB33|nr:uncharacterized protein LOC119613691 [Lucilia sericata]